MGAVIGHELTHGFDDQGAQFDSDGNLKNWWTKDDLERFKMYIENNEFKPAGPPASWTRTDEGQFRAEDEEQYNVSKTSMGDEAEDNNREM